MASEDPVYRIHSKVRHVTTRTQRALSPKRHRFVQRFAGGTITVRRARPATVTKDKIQKHLDELRAAVAEGKIEVRTPTGQLVDLSTFQAVGRQPASKPKPKPRPDSAANDKTFPGGVGDPNYHLKHDRESAVETPAAPTSNRLPGDESEKPIEMTKGTDPAALRKEQREAAAAASTPEPAPPTVEGEKEQPPNPPGEGTDDGTVAVQVESDVKVEDDVTVKVKTGGDSSEDAKTKKSSGKSGKSSKKGK